MATKKVLPPTGSITAYGIVKLAKRRAQGLSPGTRVSFFHPKLIPYSGTKFVVKEEKGLVGVYRATNLTKRLAAVKVADLQFMYGQERLTVMKQGFALQLLNHKSVLSKLLEGKQTAQKAFPGQSFVKVSTRIPEGTELVYVNIMGTFDLYDTTGQKVKFELVTFPGQGGGINIAKPEWVVF